MSNPKLFLYAALAALFLGPEVKAMNEIRTYMSFSLPVDPALIQSIPDMDMSYALAATLVEWDLEKQISAGLAESWRISGPSTYSFTIRQGAHWSNGEPLTSCEVKASLERGIKAHPKDLRSLIQMLDSISCPTLREVEFTLKVPAQGSGLPRKLTEPNYGILKIVNEIPDLNITTGPFYLSKSTSTDLTLLHNLKWHRYEPNNPTPVQVIIRKPPKEMDSQQIVLNDKWPNLIETSSLINVETLKKYKSEGFEIWNRPLDKFFHLHLGKRITNAEGQSLIRYLRKRIGASEFVAGLSGFNLTEQIFPRGYKLFDPEFECKIDGDEKLPTQFQKKPLDVMITPARVTPALKENIRRALLGATGISPNFISVPLEEVTPRKIKGDFDLYAGTVGMADPDPEGIMSFLLESDAPIIHSSHGPHGNEFLERLDEARKQKDENQKFKLMRSILNEAVNEGDIFPLFHLSTIGIGRNELDFRNIPSSDESVTLSRIRFKPQHQAEARP
jgi:MarR-like DNA-binding transcriptional regulator SgrR of sgrS sRNA